MILLLAVQVAWARDVDAALAEAKRSDRLVVLHFQLAGRPLCKQMNEETFVDPDVVRRLNAMLPVFVDMASQPDLFDRTVGGKGALGSAVVDASLDPVSVQAGYAGPRDFLRLLERAERGYAGLKAARGKGVDTPGLYALGDVYRALESPRRAEACWREVLGRVSTSEADLAAAAWSHERLARSLVLRGKNLEARKHLEELRKSGLRPDRALLTEGMILSMERRHEEAGRVLEEALRLHPSGDEADLTLLTLGFVRHEKGEGRPALEALEGLLRRFPGSPWAAEARLRIEHIRNPPPEHPH